MISCIEEMVYIGNSPTSTTYVDQSNLHFVTSIVECHIANMNCLSDNSCVDIRYIVSKLFWSLCVCVCV